MKTVSVWKLAALAGLALGVTAGSAHAQCISGLAGSGVRYAYSQNHGFGISFSFSAWEWDGRVRVGKLDWEGNLIGGAQRGGQDYDDECDPAYQCYCNYVTDYADGDAISESWEKASDFEFDDPSDYYSYTQEGDYGWSSAQGASVSLNTTRGHVNANPWSFSFGTEGESASVSNESGSKMNSAIGSSSAICFTDCKNDYSYYVGSASGAIESQEQYILLLNPAPNDSHMAMSMRLQASANYSTSFIDAALYGTFCVGQPHQYYAAVPITCIGTPHALTMTTQIDLSVKLVNIVSGDADPTSVIESWDFSGSYTTTPFAFSSTGYFTLMNSSTGSSHNIANSDDYGLPPGTRVSESWSGYGGMDEYIYFDCDYEHECALIVTRKTTISCP